MEESHFKKEKPRKYLQFSSFLFLEFWVFSRDDQDRHIAEPEQTTMQLKQNRFSQQDQYLKEGLVWALDGKKHAYDIWGYFLALSSALWNLTENCRKYDLILWLVSEYELVFIFLSQWPFSKPQLTDLLCQ